MTTFCSNDSYSKTKMPFEREWIMADYWLNRVSTAQEECSFPNIHRNGTSTMADSYVPVEKTIASGEETSSSSLTERIDNYLAEIKSRNIFIHNLTEIRSYLLEHEELAEVVLCAIQACREQFKHNTQLSLEVSKDPEIDEKTLVLFVRQQQYDTDISDKIEKIDEKYVDLLPGRSGYFLVMTDYQSPRC